MFVAMNRFTVNEGQGEKFEQIWRERESRLADVPGFMRFALLKGDGGEYISHSTWQDREAFISWTQSENFAAGHRQGSLMGVLKGPPQVALYDAVLVEGE
ncbi:MAG: antibiotic biosynthesis monooxygenase [Chloroflexota bacterium]